MSASAFVRGIATRHIESVQSVPETDPMYEKGYRAHVVMASGQKWYVTDTDAQYLAKIKAAEREANEPELSPQARYDIRAWEQAKSEIAALRLERDLLAAANAEAQKALPIDAYARMVWKQWRADPRNYLVAREVAVFDKVFGEVTE